MTTDATPQVRPPAGRLLLAAFAAAAAMALWLVPSANAQLGGVSFHDVTGAGIDYARGPGADEALAEKMYRKNPYTFQDLAMKTPAMNRFSGVALLDYNTDGCVDILAANGPTKRGDPRTGPGVSLYRNMRCKTGRLTFKDVSSESGLRGPTRGLNVAGVAYADIDNNGCEDILLTGDDDRNKLFHQVRRNGRCTGRFDDVSARSGLAAAGPHMSASFGDVNGDGRVDVVIAESWHRQNSMPCMMFTPKGDGIGRNHLYLNTGHLHFNDVTRTSGILSTTGFRDSKGARPDLDGLPTITWGTSIVDYDGDGRPDILFATDQCMMPPARYQYLSSAKLIDRGFIQVFRNQGDGTFKNVTTRVHTDRIGAWMGLSFADFDFNHRLDLFGTSLGDYLSAQPHTYPYPLGETASKPLYGKRDGTFADRGAGKRIKATGFGWGTAAIDYDNDGCTDEIYVGGADVPFLVDRSNPGTLLHNLCGKDAGQFETDQFSYPPTPDKIRNLAMGLATGDLNGDGSTDLVTLSVERVPAQVPPLKYNETWGARSDATAVFFPRLMPMDPNRPLWSVDTSDHQMPQRWMYMGWSPEAGSLRVETNSGDSNGWVKVRTVGAKNIARTGRVNRDGIGALVQVTPAGGRTASVPEAGGSSFLSQNDRTLGFGLGSAKTATVDVVWPGGTRNRLYGVKSGETIVFPEIPCRFKRRVRDRAAYARCVSHALTAEQKAGIINRRQRARFERSALRAYDEANRRRSG